MVINLLIIFLLTGVNAVIEKNNRGFHSSENVFRPPNDQEKQIWKNLSAQWSQAEKSAEKGFNPKIFSQMIKIYNLFEEKILNREDMSDGIKIRVIGLEVRSHIIHHAVDCMKEALLHDNYRDNATIFGLADAISATNDTLFKIVIRKLILKSLQELPMNKLIQDLSCHNQVSQNLAALLSMDYYLRQYIKETPKWLRKYVEKNPDLSAKQKAEILKNLLARESNEQNRIKIAFKIYQITKSSEFRTFSESDKKEIENFINSLNNNSAKNLYFANEVCFRNHQFNDLYLRTTDAVPDNGFRLILERGKRQLNDYRASWLPNIIDERTIRFESKRHRNQFMYAIRLSVELFGFIEVDHFYGGSVGLLSPSLPSEWEITFSHDGAYILNKATNLYLSLTPTTHDAFVIRMKEKSASCVWVVEDCKNSNTN